MPMGHEQVGQAQATHKQVQAAAASPQAQGDKSGNGWRRPNGSTSKHDGLVKFQASCASTGKQPIASFERHMYHAPVVLQIALVGGALAYPPCCRKACSTC